MSKLIIKLMNKYVNLTKNDHKNIYIFQSIEIKTKMLTNKRFDGRF